MTLAEPICSTVVLLDAIASQTTPNTHYTIETRCVAACLDASPRPAPTREQIDQVEQFLLTQPQRQIETVTWLAGGMLYRRITIPADTFATGAVHKRDHISVMVCGDMLVSTDRGMERVIGFQEWHGRAGHKRVGYAFQDTVWLTAHRTDATTVEEAEADLFENAEMLLSRREWAAIEVAA